MTTEGDLDRTTPLAELGGTGVFVSALRSALVEGRVDLAVHSLKDLPTAAHPATRLAAIPVREDARDALVARDALTLGELPAGATVGTGSPRRRAQLAALGLGLVVTRPARQRRHSAAGCRRGPPRRRRAGSGGPAPPRPHRRGHRGARPHPDAARPPARAPSRSRCGPTTTPRHPPSRPWTTPTPGPAPRRSECCSPTLEAGCTAPVGALAEVVDGVDGPELSLRAVVAAPRTGPSTCGGRSSVTSRTRRCSGTASPDSSSPTAPPASTHPPTAPSPTTSPRSVHCEPPRGVDHTVRPHPPHPGAGGLRRSRTG